MKSRFAHVLAVAVLAFAGFAQAQEQRPSYGANVSLDQAKRIAAGAAAEARKQNWPMAIAIVDTTGALVYYEKLEDTQTASPTIAIEKARTAAMYRRPTRVFEEVVNKGRTAVLNLTGVMPITGCLPIVAGGKVLGGIGVSGMASDQDEQVAKAGLDGMR
jgi:glc operon protein GlcG